jgi:hypothetical protein
VALYVLLRIVQMVGWAGMTAVKDVHLGLAILLIVWNAAIAAWGLLASWRRWRLIRGFVILAMTGWFLFVPQVLFGIDLYVNDHRAPGGWQHYIYGIGAALGIGAGLFYRGRLRGREGMLFGLVALFLMGVAIRALLTGRA